AGGEAAAVPARGGVLLWTAGFDVLSALQDVEFDRRAGLHSLPVRLGAVRAVRAARAFHAVAVAALLGAAWAGGLGVWFVGGVVVVGLLLLWEHRMVGPGRLERLEDAFFGANAAVSVVMLVAVLGEVYLGAWG
ncbi:MAG: UbiA family prenyltransferase, partial [Candidatus Bipolaricaulota bacterium]